MHQTTKTAMVLNGSRITSVDAALTSFLALAKFQSGADLVLIAHDGPNGKMYESVQNFVGEA